LTARALGADGIIVTGNRDRRLVETINRVTKQFGGSFTIEMGKSWRESVLQFRRSGGKVIHLTAYGMPLPRVIGAMRGWSGDLLVVVGAEKVPGELYHIADWNVAVTNQPISEVSALGVFLDWLSEHRDLERPFSNAVIRIVPTEHGKKVFKA
jgi:tRNA (cytidine56-2'-O)-methyltransferase